MMDTEQFLSPRPCPQFLIAAPSSHSGKTTLTLALMQALVQRGLRVQSFKCGPDYLDPQLHTQLLGRPARNLDTIMADPAWVETHYRQHTVDVDAVLVEGMMGLFDGAERERGSTAEIARQLRVPVVLVVDAWAMAHSAAAVLRGFRQFDLRVEYAGVIFNRVGSPGHYRLLTEAAHVAGFPPLGYLPHHAGLMLPERYLGLVAEVHPEWKTFLEQATALVESYVDLDLLLERTRRPRLPRKPQSSAPVPNAGRKPRIAVARDAAFQFLYTENLEFLARHAELVYFSPVSDTDLPQADGLYLAGGYPELQVEALSRNTAMRQAIRAFCTGGGACWAECGGMMYLGEAIIDAGGERHEMVGVFPLETTMQQPGLHLGYRRWHLPQLTVNGHEFHISRMEVLGPLETEGQVTDQNDSPVDTRVYVMQQTRATYLHLFWPSAPSILTHLWPMEPESTGGTLPGA